MVGERIAHGFGGLIQCLLQEYRQFHLDILTLAREGIGALVAAFPARAAAEDRTEEVGEVRLCLRLAVATLLAAAGIAAART